MCVCVGLYPHSNRGPITYGTMGPWLLSQRVEQRSVHDCKCSHTCVCVCALTVHTPTYWVLLTMKQCYPTRFSLLYSCAPQRISPEKGKIDVRAPHTVSVTVCVCVVWCGVGGGSGKGRCNNLNRGPQPKGSLKIIYRVQSSLSFLHLKFRGYVFFLSKTLLNCFSSTRGKFWIPVRAEVVLVIDLAWCATPRGDAVMGDSRPVSVKFWGTETWSLSIVVQRTTALLRLSTIKYHHRQLLCHEISFHLVSFLFGITFKITHHFVQ